MKGEIGILILSQEVGGIGVRVQKSNEIEDTAVLYCTGFIDTYNSSQFMDAVNSVIKDGAKNLVFDLAKITYISSSGIGCFTTFLKNIKPKGGDLVLVSMIKKVSDVFELLGFQHFFNTANSLEEALSTFPQKRVAPKVPFEKMQAITSAFERLEQYVEKDRQQRFYVEVLDLLRHIEDLRRIEARK